MMAPSPKSESIVIPGITVKEPFASALVCPGKGRPSIKNHETRTWQTLPGPMFIHTQRDVPSGSDLSIMQRKDFQAEISETWGPNGFRPDALYIGHIIGVVNFGKRIKISDVMAITGNSELQYMLGYWAKSKYAWPVTSAGYFKAPIRVGGAKLTWGHPIPLDKPLTTNGQDIPFGNWLKQLGVFDED